MHAVDVNGDGSADLVWIDPIDRGHTVTLFRHDSDWTVTAVDPAANIDADAPPTANIDTGWSPGSVNTDGAGDFVRIRVTATGTAYAETLTGHGDGHFSATSTPLPAGTMTGSGLADEDNQDWMPVALDHSGLTDFVKVEDHQTTVTVRTVMSDGLAGWTNPAPWTSAPMRSLGGFGPYRVTGDTGTAVAGDPNANPTDSSSSTP